MTRPHVLVADDDPLLRSLLEHKLTARGYRVRLCPDGDAAYASLTEDRPDLLVLDAMMPGLDGFALLRRLRDEGRLAQTRVIMLSARRLEKDIVEALRLGASDYLAKPFSPEELAVRIARLLPAGSA